MFVIIIFLSLVTVVVLLHFMVSLLPIDVLTPRKLNVVVTQSCGR